jgi:hypothetical protein
MIRNIAALHKTNMIVTGVPTRGTENTLGSGTPVVFRYSSLDASQAGTASGNGPQKGTLRTRVEAAKPERNAVVDVQQPPDADELNEFVAHIIRIFTA